MEKEKKKYTFLKKSVKNYNLIYFSYKSDLEEKIVAVYIGPFSELISSLEEAEKKVKGGD